MKEREKSTMTPRFGIQPTARRELPLTEMGKTVKGRKSRVLF